MKYLFANWKENKNWDEAESYFETFRQLAESRLTKERCLVFFPPSPFIIPLCQRLGRAPWRWGVQDLSRFVSGAHTGEVAAAMIKNFADFALLGHSERRRDLGETVEVINQKLGQAVAASLHLVVCLSQLSEAEALILPSGSSGEIFLTYEPAAFVGLEEVQGLKLTAEFHQGLRRLFKTTPFRFIYGGSVGPQNARDLLKEDFIDGLLVGHHSLDPQSFWQIVQA